MTLDIKDTTVTNISCQQYREVVHVTKTTSTGVDAISYYKQYISCDKD